MEFGLLGPLAAWSVGCELPLGAPKQRALLALLLLRAGEPVPTPWLVDALWGERPPPTAVKAAQVYVSRLRKVLGDGVIETHPLGYVLRLEPDGLDVRRFERLLERGRRLLDDGDAAGAADELRRALELWRGPALADFRYEPFARDESARLEELRLVALETRLEAELALGRHAAAVPELETLVREHPLREGPRALLMLALYRSGRQAEALAVCQDARDVLREELGLSPGQALQQLEKAILVQDPALELPAHAPAARATTAPLAATAAVRKTVTVLACGVARPPDGGESLDPEALRNLTGRLRTLATAVVERHGGTLDPAGAELAAVFGVPTVHEDDPLRASRAALELARSAAEEGIEVRSGVETGEVVTGDPTAGEGLVTGDVLSAARGFRERAGAGETVLGPRAHALVAHAVAVEPLSSAGEGAAAAYRLHGLDERASALPRRDDLPLVGRARELELLRSLYGAAAAGGGGRAALVVGEAGIGKSRLVRELLDAVAGEATVLVGRCPPYGEGIAFWPLRELLREAGRSDEVLAGPSHEVYAAVRRELEALAEERPLVVAFDDVHWGEPTFLDFVEYLAGRLGRARMLLLCLARLELDERRPDWLRPPWEPIALEPLSGEATQTLLEAIGVPPAGRTRVAEAAEGNPLFVEQLVAIGPSRLASDELPGSIRALLHDRLDRLEREERALLERGAVAGRGFSLADVLDLTPPGERERVHERLLALVRRRLLRPDPAAPDDGFRFHHALVRDAAYEGIPKTARADLHEQVARRLARAEADEALVGHHLERAYRLRADVGRPDAALAARAGMLLRDAGRRAFERSDLPGAVSLLERARALLPADDAALLAPRLGQALFEAGRLEEAGAVLDDALATAGGDAALEARARVERAFVRLQAAPAAGLAEARAAADGALSVFEANADDGLARAWALRAFVEWTEGRVEAADTAWSRAAVSARVAGEERELHELLGWRASAAVEGPTHVDDAIRTCERIRAQVRASPVAVALTLHPLAALHAMRGEDDEARALVRQANAVLEGLTRMQSAVSHHEALVELLAGDPAAAEARLREGHERLAAMGERALLATTEALLAQAVHAQGRAAEAEELCAASAAGAAAEDLVTQAIWRGVKAKLLAREDRPDEAEALARHAVALLERTDMLSRRGDALLDLADTLRLAGRDDDADAAAADAAECYERKGNAVAAERARTAVPARGAGG